MVLNYGDENCSERNLMDVGGAAINEIDLNTSMAPETVMVDTDETSSFTNTEFEFALADWDYLKIAQHSIQNQIVDNNGIDISPSISNHTLQSLRPTFSSEYETDNTEFISLVDSTNQTNINLAATANHNPNDKKNYIHSIHHVADNMKANHEFAFHHTLAANYWDYMLEKENLLNEEGFDFHQFQESNVAEHEHEYKETGRLKSRETNKSQIQSLERNFDYEDAGKMIQKDSEDIDYDFEVPSVRSASTSNLSEDIDCDTSKLCDGNVAEYKSIYERYENEVLERELEEVEHLYDRHLDADPNQSTIEQQLYHYSETEQNYNRYGASSLSSLMSESSTDSSIHYDPSINEFNSHDKQVINSTIYEWPDDETTGTLNLYNRIKIQLKYLEPKIISDAVLKTIREEFVVQDLFLSGDSPPTPEIPKSIRKKSDRDVEWTPLSVYKAYTNIKSPTNGKDSYNRLVPYSSCIGTLNYRPKDHAAWKRSPNRR
ncbi:uncharacterized protein KGF55_000719 [Candida pseudojiufengensis]|uniref:uncharacterized protein n=1 Tax=Candida pseudojiufengensis TaxID=497109 RepID=UPI0022251987|nr:uncharacterized protein KGF55_000719 [Candida pseudojiufengensis]KAI5966410.1 hypothetical protein KGF55_000719 [Candida pseudojiufengensis]